MNQDKSDTIGLPDLYLGSSMDQDQADTLGLPDLCLGSSMDQEQADTIGLPDLYLGSLDVQVQSEDQYRPMTPGEEEIMKIHTDGISCSPDMIEKSGGFWITSSSVKPKESCSRQGALQPPITAASESDSELEELLRDRITEEASPGATGKLEAVVDELKAWVKEQLPWLKEDISSSETSDPRTPAQI